MQGLVLALALATPAPEGGGAETITQMRNRAMYTQDPEQAFKQWSVLAKHPRATRCQRANAVLQMGLSRTRQGRDADALVLFQRALRFGGGPAETASLQIGHAHFRLGDHAAALAAYRTAEQLYSPARHMKPTEEWRYPLYQGMSLEHLGRRHEAVAEYASSVLSAPLWWRTPLAAHLIEMYDAAGQPEVLQRFVDGIDPDAYFVTLPIRRLLIVHRLEKSADWPTLVAHLKAAPPGDPRRMMDRQRGYVPFAIARALARHCQEAVPLLEGPRSKGTYDYDWMPYALALCGQRPEAPPFPSRQPEDLWARDLPDLGFPPISRGGALPDPIVAAVHTAPKVSAARAPDCR